MNMRILTIGLVVWVWVGFGCTKSNSIGDNSRTSVASGTYLLMAMEHVAPPSNEVITANGGAIMDGFGNSVLTYRNSKGQNAVDNDSYSINSMYQIDVDKNDPGAITPDGQFVFRVRQADGPSIWMFHKQVPGAVTSLVNGQYHYVGYRHVNNGPGLLTGSGTASFTGSGGYTINATLSNNTIEARVGAVNIINTGVVTATEGTDTFLGFVDPEGSLVVWLDVELTTGAFIRMDIFVRNGSGMHQATLNGTYNLGRFFQGSLVETPGSGFGTITFDGQGNWTMDYTDNNSTRRTDSGTLIMNSNGAATLTSQTSTMQAFLTPNANRRILFIADTDVSNGEVGFFVATDR